MTYQVLARKWRPQNFETLVGQQHVMQALVNSLDSGRLHHAYLFTGTRGVGKTTIARLIAKALNCEQGVSSKPCGVCSSCVDIAAGRFVDLMEVDAASRTKVEDTRDLLENVQYAPTRGRFKVYLIDEVHMLSGHSFNALLKTLEEPPAHVKFLLATTDPQKLPVTVLSRCLQLHLKNLTVPQIAEHLEALLVKENLSFELPALTLLATHANGSMRDGLSLLDQAIAVGNGAVNLSTVEFMLGVTSEHVVQDLLVAFIAQELPALLQVSEQLQALGANYAQVLTRLQEIWHQAALVQFGAILAGENDLIRQVATGFDPESIQLFYEITSIGRRDLALSPSPKLGFEMVLLRLLAFRPRCVGVVNTAKSAQVAMSAPVKPVAVVTKPKIEAAVMVKETPPWQQDPVPVAQALPVTPNVMVQPVSPINASCENWAALVPRLGLTAFSKVLAEHVCFERQEADHYYLSLATEHALMLQERHQTKIKDALSAHFGKKMHLTIQLGRSEQSQSPLAVNQQQQQTRVQQALHTLSQDAPLQKILTSFDGKLLPNSLQFEESD